MKFFKKTSVISCYHFSSSVPHSTDLFGSVTLSAVTGGSCRSLASTVPILFRYPFGAPLRSHLLYLSVPFLSALRNVLCKTSMINTLFLIAFTYSYLRILTVAQEIRTVNAVLSHYCSLQFFFFPQYQNRICRKCDRSSFAFGALLSGIKLSKQHQILCCGVTNGKPAKIHRYSFRRGISQQ